MLRTLVAIVVVCTGLVACGGKGSKEQALPITERNIEGNWRMTKVEPVNSTAKDAPTGESFAQNNENDEYEIRLQDGKYTAMTSDDVAMDFKVTVDYKLDGNKLITIDKDGLTMPDYQVIKVTTQTLVLKPLDNEDGELNLTFTRVLNADMADHRLKPIAQTLNADAVTAAGKVVSIERRNTLNRDTDFTLLSCDFRTYQSQYNFRFTYTDLRKTEDGFELNSEDTNVSLDANLPLNFNIDQQSGAFLPYNLAVTLRENQQQPPAIQVYSDNPANNCKGTFERSGRMLDLNIECTGMNDYKAQKSDVKLHTSCLVTF
jgi:hypothetical protein